MVFGYSLPQSVIVEEVVFDREIDGVCFFNDFEDSDCVGCGRIEVGDGGQHMYSNLRFLHLCTIQLLTYVQYTTIKVVFREGSFLRRKFLAKEVYLKVTFRE